MGRAAFRCLPRFLDDAGRGHTKSYIIELRKDPVRGREPRRSHRRKGAQRGGSGAVLSVCLFSSSRIFSYFATASCGSVPRAVVGKDPAARIAAIMRFSFSVSSAKGSLLFCVRSFPTQKFPTFQNTPGQFGDTAASGRSGSTGLKTPLVAFGQTWITSRSHRMLRLACRRSRAMAGWAPLLGTRR